MGHRRFKFYMALKKMPLIKRYAFRIVLWIWPPTKDDWKRIWKWILEDE